MIKKTFEFILGFLILFGFYFLSALVIKVLKITFPPAILGLMLFATALISGIIKENWIKTSVDFIMKYLPMLFIPFIVGIVAYKNLLMQNLPAVLVVIFITTIATIVGTGVFVEYGIKFLRLWRMKHND